MIKLHRSVVHASESVIATCSELIRT